MKTIEHSQRIVIPKAVKVKVVSRVVSVTGPRGTLKRDFRHLALDIKVIGKGVVVTKYFGTKKELAAVRTVCSHIQNMFKGVQSGFLYKLKSVYAHFPINLVIPAGGSKLEIRNFLGEKYNRLVPMEPGTTVSATGVKDEIQIEGNSLESVSKCAALIQQCCKVKHKDIRKFLDGVYVSEKGVKE